MVFLVFMLVFSHAMMGMDGEDKKDLSRAWYAVAFCAKDTTPEGSCDISRETIAKKCLRSTARFSLRGEKGYQADAIALNFRINKKSISGILKERQDDSPKLKDVLAELLKTKKTTDKILVSLAVCEKWLVVTQEKISPGIDGTVEVVDDKACYFVPPVKCEQCIILPENCPIFHFSSSEKDNFAPEGKKSAAEEQLEHPKTFWFELNRANIDEFLANQRDRNPGISSVFYKKFTNPFSLRLAAMFNVIKNFGCALTVLIIVSYLNGRR